MAFKMQDCGCYSHTNLSICIGMYLDVFVKVTHVTAYSRYDY